MGPSKRRASARAWAEAVVLARRVLDHDLPKLAASLTYFAVLSLFPALIVVVALLAVIGLSSTSLHALLDAVGDLGARWAVDLVSGVLDSILNAHSSGIVLGLSTLVSLYAASAYVNAFMWASDGIYQVERRRPYWRGLPLRLALAVVLLLLLAAAAAALALVGPFGNWVADLTGIGNGPLHVWTWVKWPILLALGLLMFGLLYRFAPSRPQPALWRLLPGAVAGVTLWLVVSVGFSVYLSHFASYNRVYGTLGAAVAFLVWAWLTNLAVLVGVELNRELELRHGT